VKIELTSTAIQPASILLLCVRCIKLEATVTSNLSALSKTRGYSVVLAKGAAQKRSRNSDQPCLQALGQAPQFLQRNGLNPGAHFILGPLEAGPKCYQKRQMKILKTDSKAISLVARLC